MVNFYARRVNIGLEAIGEDVVKAFNSHLHEAKMASSGHDFSKGNYIHKTNEGEIHIHDDGSAHYQTSSGDKYHL